MSKSLNKIIQYAVALAIVVLCVYYALKDIDFVKLWSIIENANYLWVLYTIPIMIFSHVIRAYRWKYLLKPFMNAKSLWNLFSAVMIGYLMNNILPRGGEFIRPIIYARRERVSKTSVFSTIVIERFLDVLTLMSLFAIALFFKRKMLFDTFTWLTTYRITIFAILTVISIIFLIILAMYPVLSHSLLRIVLKPFPKNSYEKITSLWDKFLKGLAVVKTPRLWAQFIFHSYFMWLFYILPMYLTFYSFGFQDRLHLGFWDASLILIIVGIAFSIAPAPGAIGVYHSVVQVAMVSFYGISREEALAYATLNHGVNYIVQVLIGLICLFIENRTKLPDNPDINIEKNVVLTGSSN
jgi:glycosyltransferase 2 family protein